MERNAMFDYNNFLRNCLITLTENGALSNVTTGSELVDQFGKAGSYCARDIYSVFNDQSKIWN